jgi:hypothetical protein
MSENKKKLAMMMCMTIVDEAWDRSDAKQKGVNEMHWKSGYFSGFVSACMNLPLEVTPSAPCVVDFGESR